MGLYNAVCACNERARRSGHCTPGDETAHTSLNPANAAASTTRDQALHAVTPEVATTCLGKWSGGHGGGKRVEAEWVLIIDTEWGVVGEWVCYRYYNTRHQTA